MLQQLLAQGTAETWVLVVVVAWGAVHVGEGDLEEGLVGAVVVGAGEGAVAEVVAGAEGKEKKTRRRQAFYIEKLKLDLSFPRQSRFC